MGFVESESDQKFGLDPRIDAVIDELGLRFQHVYQYEPRPWRRGQDMGHWGFIRVWQAAPGEAIEPRRPVFLYSLWEHYGTGEWSCEGPSGVYWGALDFGVLPNLPKQLELRVLLEFQALGRAEGSMCLPYKKWTRRQMHTEAMDFFEQNCRHLKVRKFRSTDDLITGLARRRKAMELSRG